VHENSEIAVIVNHKDSAFECGHILGAEAKIVPLRWCQTTMCSGLRHLHK
jgi:hypothetical protein